MIPKSIMLIGLLSLSGCASPGGMVVGPLSALSARSIDRERVSRYVSASPDITDAQRGRYLRAVQLSPSADPESVAVGIGVDFLAPAPATGSEWARQVAAVIADLGLIYGAVSVIADERADKKVDGALSASEGGEDDKPLPQVYAPSVSIGGDNSAPIEINNIFK